jgi:MATE family multidrug resistance protein
MNCVRPITFALLIANLVNAFVNWVLIYGKLGFPAMGATGAAWATVGSRISMAGILLAAIVLRERRQRSGLRLVDRRVDWPALRRLIGLGLPASLQITLEVGVFAMAMALAGRLSAVALAAHQIALNYASTTYMVPLGVANSGAVRVGQAVGRRDPEGAWISGWTAILLGVGFMGCAASAFLIAPRGLIGFFTTDPGVLDTGASLLIVAAVFQMFDGLQGVATGALRGLGDTRTPMVMNLIGHWAIGLPAGYMACFWWGWGVQGLWIGLSAGLIFVGVALLRTWRQRIAALRAGVPAGAG